MRNDRYGVVRVLLGSFAAVITAVFGGQTAHAGAVYRHGTHGVDISYPNCGVRGTGTFGVVGVNGGRPFSFNPCLRGEYARYAHSSSSALYLNTGFEHWYTHAISPECAASRHRRGLAYAVGCSEAATSVRHLAQMGLSEPRVWWLDVEPSNVWSGNRALNTSVLRGMMDYLDRFTSAVVGFYSLSSWWNSITTRWKTTAPEWIPSRTRAVCPNHFSAGPVWLAQGGGARLDLDVAC